MEQVYEVGNKGDKIKIKDLLLKTLLISDDHLKNLLLSSSSLKELVQGESIEEESITKHLPFHPDFPRSRKIIPIFELLLQ